MCEQCVCERCVCVSACGCVGGGGLAVCVCEQCVCG